MTILIGDVHGHYKQYGRILKNCKNSIQVGDLGLGFRHTTGWRAGEFTQNPPHQKMLDGNHRFIRGNHDNPGECKKNSQWIADGTIENGVMFIGGADSTDKAWRVKDCTWWENEELSQQELYDLTEKYIDAKPAAMVTHNCPAEVLPLLHSHHLTVGRTEQAFQSMWSAHSPKVWVFGHHHKSFDQVLRGTRFVCLAELEAKDIDLTA